MCPSFQRGKRGLNKSVVPLGKGRGCRGSRMSQRALFWRPVSISALPFTALTTFLPNACNPSGLGFFIYERSNIPALQGSCECVSVEKCTWDFIVWGILQTLNVVGLCVRGRGRWSIVSGPGAQKPQSFDSSSFHQPLDFL